MNAEPTTDQALVVYDRPRALPVPAGPTVPWDSWPGMIEFAKIAGAAQGVLPKHITTWQGALVVMQKALELGVPPVEGLMGIYLVNGRVVVAARLMAGMVTRSFGPRGLEVIETTDTRCTVRYYRPGMAEPRELTWTIEQARTANLAGKEVWKAYPRAMLRNRCISEVCSYAYADVVGGMYAAGDLDDVPFRVTAGGDVEVDSAALAAQQPVAPVNEGDLPAPEKWIPELAHMAGKLKITTGEDIPVNDSMTRAEARALKARLTTLLAEAEARMAAARSAPAVPDHVDPADEALPF